MEDGGDLAEHRQRYDLVAPTKQKRIGVDQQRADVLPVEFGECGVDVRIVAGIGDDQLLLHLGCRAAHIAAIENGVLAGGVDQHAESNRVAHHLAHQLQAFGGERVGQHGHAGHVAAGPAQARDIAELDRIAAEKEHDRDARGRSLGGGCGRRRNGDDHIDVPCDQIGSHGRQLVVTAFRPVIIDPDVAAVDKAGLAEPVLKSGHEFRPFLGGGGAEKSHHRHRHLLRARSKRPSGRRAADQRDELAPPHSITSSAIAVKLIGTASPRALAVLELMTSSNFTGAWTGSSLGLAPFKMRST